MNQDAVAGVPERTAVCVEPDLIAFNQKVVIRHVHARAIVA